MTNGFGHRRAAVKSSPLMLMVLVLLAEAPMHPYEMQRLMQWRGKDQVVRVQRGSLYPAVERLARAGLIEPLETAREGRRPERTVYQLTEAGRDTAEAWLATMVRTVRNEFPEFPAALSFIADAVGRGCQGPAHRPPARVGQADRRAAIASPRTCARNTNCQGFSPWRTSTGWPCCEAEHAWVSALLDDLASGELYWDRNLIREWADGLQDRMGSFPGIPRMTSTDEDPSP